MMAKQKSLSFLPCSDTGYINHIPRQIPCPGVVEHLKMDFMFPLCVIFVLVFFIFVLLIFISRSYIYDFPLFLFYIWNVTDNFL